MADFVNSDSIKDVDGLVNSMTLFPEEPFIDKGSRGIYVDCGNGVIVSAQQRISSCGGGSYCSPPYMDPPYGTFEVACAFLDTETWDGVYFDSNVKLLDLSTGESNAESVAGHRTPEEVIRILRSVEQISEDDFSTIRNRRVVADCNEFGL